MKGMEGMEGMEGIKPKDLSLWLNPYIQSVELALSSLSLVSLLNQGVGS
jgi:hypothetical protein